MAHGRCPKCSQPLASIRHEGISADYCRACGGLWLDHGELARVEGCPEDLPPRSPDQVEVVRDTPYFCPTCGAPLQEREFTPGSRLWLDQCTQCGGLYFDAGELRRARSLRGRFRRPVTRAQAAEMDALRREWRRQKQRQSGRRNAEKGPWAEGRQREDPGKGSRVYLFQLLTGLPVEVHNPVRHTPYVTYALVALCVLIFVLPWLAGAAESMAETYGLRPAALLRGEGLFNLVASMFLHGGLAHLAGNMYFLWIFGDNVEDLMRPARYVVFYLVCGVAADLAHVLASGASDVPLIGASGAIAGVMGAYMVLFRDRLIYVMLFFFQFKVPAPFYLAFWVGWQLFYATFWGAGAGGVAWWAHIGGFAAGVLLALVFRMRGRLEASEGYVRT